MQPVICIIGTVLNTKKLVSAEFSKELVLTFMWLSIKPVVQAAWHPPQPMSFHFAAEERAADEEDVEMGGEK
jgi:hypothetical protein